MRNEEYNKMIEIVKMFNAKQISKEETYKNISNILSIGKYDELIIDFDRLFSSILVLVLKCILFL